MTDDFEVQDTSGLIDADWAEINKLRKAYEAGSRKAVDLALKKLAKDPIRFAVVIGALFPDMMREMIRDQLNIFAPYGMWKHHRSSQLDRKYPPPGIP